MLAQKRLGTGCWWCCRLGLGRPKCNCLPHLRGMFQETPVSGLPFNSDHHHHPFSWEFLWLSSQRGLTELCQLSWEDHGCSLGTGIGGKKFRSTSQPNLACLGSLWPKSSCFCEPLGIGSCCKLLLWVTKIKVAKNGLFLTWVSSLTWCSAQYVHEMGLGEERLAPAQCGYQDLRKKWELLKSCWRLPNKIHIQVCLLKQGQ